jgi:hypothetical protein
MIARCGETYTARMERLSNWHDFFALLPHKVDEEDGKDVCAWLQVIQRKGVWMGYPIAWDWQYRLKP